MGRRGPSPQPTALRVLRGNPGKRRLKTREPGIARAAPTCPRWISPEAKAAWRRVVPWLKRAGVLTMVDQDALTAYCQTYARWKRAEQFIEKHGEVYPIKDENGNIRYMQQLPQVAIARVLLNVLRTYQQEFGMTPSARTRVQALPEPTDPENERFFTEGL